MIQTRPAPCYRIEPSPRPDFQDHFADLAAAERALRDYRDEKSAIVQEEIPCGHLACDGCETQYDDLEDGVYHLLNDDDEAMAKLFAVHGGGWTLNSSGRIHCPSCPPLPPAPGPGPDDQPLPFTETP